MLSNHVMKVFQAEMDDREAELRGIMGEDAYKKNPVVSEWRHGAQMFYQAYQKACLSFTEDNHQEYNRFRQKSYKMLGLAETLSNDALFRRAWDYGHTLGTMHILAYIHDLLPWFEKVEDQEEADNAPLER